MQMTLVPRSCPLCGSADQSRVFAEANLRLNRLDAYAFASRKMPEYMHHRLVACPTCDLLYASPVPTQGELAAAYQTAAYDSAEEAGFASRTYGRYLRPVLTKLPDRQGALDIGAGDGSFLQTLIAAGFRGVRGVEPSAAPLALAKDEIKKLITHDIFRPQEFAPGQFSLITCFQTIEHLPDPLAICRQAHGLLKEGGALFLIGHDRRSHSARILGRKSPIFDLEHLQLFSPRSAANMLKRAGFARIEVKSISNRYPLHYWLKLLPIPIGVKKRLIGFLKVSRIGYLPITLPAGNMAVIGYRSAS